MRQVPILLFGRTFWERVIDWSALADAGTIAPEDLELFRYVETADEAAAIIDGWKDWSKREHIPGR
jgi:predicted Rossmann-fold nucleotide-binding protein